MQSVAFQKASTVCRQHAACALQQNSKLLLLVCSSCSPGTALPVTCTGLSSLTPNLMMWETFIDPSHHNAPPKTCLKQRRGRNWRFEGKKKPNSLGLLLDYISYSFLLSSCLLCTWNPRAPTDQGMKGGNKISCKQVWNYYLWLWQSNSALGAFPHLPQIKQVVFKISSFFCFSLLKSAKVSMITPKIRLRTIMMTMKKNNRSYITLAAKRGSCKIRILIINNPNTCAANPYNTFLAVQQQEHAAPQPLPSVSISDALQWYLRIQSIKWN